MEGAGGIGGLLAVVDDGGAESLFAYDGNGNVSELIAADSRSTVAHYEYDAFGNTVLATGTAAADNAYRFSTKYADDETGLVYYGKRFYDPTAGRWVTRDPIGEAGGRNLYIFVANNGVLLVDAYGLSWYDGENAEAVSNFLAGAGDSLTMGATGWVRREFGWDDVTDYGSTSYVAGEVTEIVVETTITLGGSVLRRRALQYAGKAGRAVLEGGARTTYRRAKNLVGKGGIVHHINPIRQGRFPLAFTSSARGFWNLTWLPTRAAHTRTHRYLAMLDGIDYVRTWSQPIRNIGNEIMRRLNDEARKRNAIAVSRIEDDDGGRCLYMPDISIEQTVSVSSDELVPDEAPLMMELQ
jgi:RHS repeat-associated protein